MRTFRGLLTRLTSATAAGERIAVAMGPWGLSMWIKGSRQRYEIKWSTLFDQLRKEHMARERRAQARQQ